VFIAEGKGGHQRLIPVSARFFTEASAYLDCGPGCRDHFTADPASFASEHAHH
jgi:integrase/recombinase XerD